MQVQCASSDNAEVRNDEAKVDEALLVHRVERLAKYFDLSHDQREEGIRLVRRAGGYKLPSGATDIIVEVRRRIFTRGAEQYGSAIVGFRDWVENHRTRTSKMIDSLDRGDLQRIRRIQGAQRTEHQLRFNTPQTGEFRCYPIHKPELLVETVKAASGHLKSSKAFPLMMWGYLCHLVTDGEALKHKTFVAVSDRVERDEAGAYRFAPTVKGWPGFMRIASVPISAILPDSPFHIRGQCFEHDH